MNNKTIYVLSGLIFVIAYSSGPVLSGELAPNFEQKRMPHPLVGPQHKLTADEELAGWYFCARHEIDSQWMKQQPKLSSNYRCSCSFVLKSDGSLTDLKILSSSGPAELDKSLLEAMQESFPLHESFEPAVKELAYKKTFRMDFRESDHPKYRFKIVD